MENNKAFTLTNDGKSSFFYYHILFLSIDYKYKKSRNDFIIGGVERDVASPLLSSEELYDVMLEYDDILFSF